MTVLKFISFINGRKTYLLSITGGIVFALQLLGYLDQEVANQIYTILGITGASTLRSAIK